MPFFAVKQASGHGSKERRRALAETSHPFSVQTLEWQTALLDIKWKERRGRKERRERERDGEEERKEQRKKRRRALWGFLSATSDPMGGEASA